MTRTEVEFTDDQLRAVRTAGGSVIVSAAAGSGKTSVLAERCARLVCDAPHPMRCDIDQLLVVTFTEAAAAEMRSRIRETIRIRHARQPRERHLQRQLLLVDEAHISTIHAFCHWLLRQYFMRLDLDPNAGIIDADEADLLLDEALRQVFHSRQSPGDERTTAYRQLVQHYAGGREETIAAHLVEIYKFVRTQHDPDAWLHSAQAVLFITRRDIIERERGNLFHELDRQISGVTSSIDYLDRCLPDWQVYADEMSRYAESLKSWHHKLNNNTDSFESCVSDLQQYKFKTIRSGLRKDSATDEQIQEKDRALHKYQQVKEWCNKRLHKRFALFTVDEWLSGLVQVAPYTATLVQLIGELDEVYSKAKRQRHVLDFNDLEQFAYRLLRDDGGQPSEVARAMHTKFAHVLVDEFQDINPIQDAILRQVSCETSCDMVNNLFCVGDIKQSIYRFRMAEPEIFLDRLDRSKDSNDSDACVTLSSNFRSTPQIIEGVNHIFRRLMTPALAGFDYDDEAALRPGIKGPVKKHPIEMHLIAATSACDNMTDDTDNAADFEEWLDIEKQAFLIGQRIASLVNQQECQYGDIVILLRAAATRAEQMAGVLQGMGIPTAADANTGFFAATEVSDILALLGVLDNQQQDIPLAAVMRSGTAGTRFNESELLAIKKSAPGRPFYQCVVDYLASQPDSQLKSKINSLLQFLQRFRTLSRKAPLAEVLWQIYSKTGYLAYVAGRPGGAQRHANLLMLHRRAQQFSSFGGQQSLYEFLRFIEKLRQQGQDLGPGHIPGETDNAVRIMTIHNSKGLEFPVVFLANLEKRFNLNDIRRTIIYDRKEHIGLPVTDPARRIRYPSLIQTRVRDTLHRQTLAEELRILYVALTRAKDRLILVGSTPLEEVLEARDEWRNHRGSLTELQLLQANTYLAWLIPALSCLPDAAGQWSDDPDEPIDPNKTFCIHLHKAVDTTASDSQRDSSDLARQKACSQLAPLPPGEPIDTSHPQIEALFDRLDFVYPALPLGSVPSVLNVSDFKRRTNVWSEDEDLSRRPVVHSERVSRPEFMKDSTTLSAVQTGTATHTFLQHVDFSKPDRLKEQLDNMVQQSWLTHAEAECIDLEAIAWFLSTALGRRAVGDAKNLHRELIFTAKAEVNEYDPLAEAQVQEDFILVRGMIDLVLPERNGFEVIDFKTDRISAAEVVNRRVVYEDQIRRYAMQFPESGTNRCLAGPWFFWDHDESILLPVDMNTLNQRTFEIGAELLEQATAAEPKFYQYAWWEQQVMNWAVKDHWLKTQLFRFIEVLPCLRDDADIASHLKLYLKFNGHPLPGFLDFAVGFDQPESIRGKLAATAVRTNAHKMARKFVAGSNAEEAIATIKRLRRQKQAFTIDLLGEAITSERQAEQVAQTYIDLISDLGTAARQWSRVDPVDYDSRGEYPIVNISVKLTALCSQFDPIARERTMSVVGERLAAILRAARKYDAFVNVDLEQYRYKELTFDIFEEVLSRPEFADFPDAGIVIQAYLKEAEHDLDRIIQWNIRRGAPLAIRLVKGAYWDYESSLAGHKEPPVYLQKWQSDACFERCTSILFSHVDHIRPAFGTHNVRSIAYAVACAERQGVDIHDYELQMLYGMGEPLKAAVSNMGFFLRVYTPYGDLVPGMAYLIRRLLENTANESFLRQSFAEHQPPEILLADPSLQKSNGNKLRASPAKHREEQRMKVLNNETYIDFANKECREKMIGAIRDWRESFGKTYPLVINGEKVTTNDWITSVNPANTAEVIGKVAKASIAEAERAVAAARAALPAWRKTPASERAAILRKTADIMRRRRFEIDALETLEAGKTWLEADADLAEAIDFCDYYADEIEQMCNRPRERNIPGENNTYFYEPRGVALVVAPWNFPSAILCGMTTAAAVTGNTVIMKPASFTAVIGALFMEILEQAGMPKGVVNFVAGPGSTVGDHLVRHKDVNMIVFTGSREVGLGMISAAAEVPAGQNFIKKVIAELGGKNALIVDSDADLDAAVQGVITSAFGYTGQKCSACSRAIVLQDVYDVFLDKLIAAAQSIVVGPPEDPATLVGPVIDESARKTILQYIETGKKEGRTVVDTDVSKLARQGFFVGPTIIADVDRHAVIAQEEIFGPVLAVIKARDFEDALDMANDTSYALTGGLYSRNPEHLQRIKREFQVGNLYLNRKITGALVDRQPFGGFKMSGIGSKAGGPDYLIQFVEPRTVTENTLRTGLAPDEE